MNFLFLSIGFVLLILGANFLVNGASSIARRLNVSHLVIGLTIVAFGTSMPELVVNVIASLQGNTEIAMGNILGSNIANIFIILGFSSIIRPLAVQNSTIRIEIPFSLLAILVLWVIANDSLIDEASGSYISRIDGIVLLFFFIIFLVYTFYSNTPENGNDNNGIKIMPVWKSTGIIFIGLGLLYFGGEFIVDNAVELAQQLNLAPEIIALTIVAIGTSLPELATSVVAAIKGNADIAIGNVVGSNIFNIFYILGITALINPLPYLNSYTSDVIMVMLGSLLLLGYMISGKKRSIDRWEGGLFMLLYAAYVFLRVSGNI